MQRMPAGLPPGMPGIGEEIEGAMQHAPQPARQLTLSLLIQHHGGNQGCGCFDK
jgi:elongation factor P